MPGFCTCQRCPETKTVRDLLSPYHQLFGGRLRTAVLTAVRLLGETYPSELAKFLGVRLYAIQRVLESLESEAVIVSRPVGRTRQISLNPRYFAYRELAALLWRLGREDTSTSDLKNVPGNRERARASSRNHG